MIVILGTSSLVAGFVQDPGAIDSGVWQMAYRQCRWHRAGRAYRRWASRIPITASCSCAPWPVSCCIRMLAQWSRSIMAAKPSANADLRRIPAGEGLPAWATICCIAFTSLSTSFEANVASFKDLLAEWLPRSEPRSSAARSPSARSRSPCNVAAPMPSPASAAIRWQHGSPKK